MVNNPRNGGWALFTFSVNFQPCSNFSTTESTENTERTKISVFSVPSVVEIYVRVPKPEIQ